MESLFLVVMVPILKKEEEYFLEAQAFNGIQKWSENFEKVTVVFPEKTEELNNSFKWIPIKNLKNNKIKIITLPLNYKYRKFLYDVIKNRKLLLKEIKNAKYNVFSIGSLTGDWGAIASIIAFFNGIKYAVWTDRVEHNVVKINSEKQSFLKKIYNRYFVYNLMKYYHKFLIKRSEVGLFHGNDCYIEYSKYVKKSFLVHDIHLNEKDQISLSELNKKKNELIKREYLKICYVGRASEMKGPIEWLEILSGLKKNNIKFKAKWLGDGELLDLMKRKINELDLNENIELLGFVSDKEKIKKELQESDIFLFCHKTKESPRNLIEALKSACPIIGFYSEYAEELIKENNGGILVKNFNKEKIIEEIIYLNKNKIKLIEKIVNAEKDGRKFDDTKVFRERSLIVKENLYS
jgi:glycosyltransferase involved in cell wall biosynthesis